MLENLKKLREKTGTTQRQLAEAIGVSQQSVNKYENQNLILKHLSASLTTSQCRSILSSAMRRTMVNSLRASACSCKSTAASHQSGALQSMLCLTVFDRFAEGFCRVLGFSAPLFIVFR